MAAGTGGRQQGRGESTQRRGGSQAQGILGNGENRRKHRHRHQQAKRRRGIEQRMQAHGGKYCQVQHGDAGALQNQGVSAVTRSQPPAEAEQAQCSSRDTGVAQLDRHHHALGGVAQQEGQAEEQQQHTDPQHGIAAQQPRTCSVDGALDEVGFRGLGGR
ncbi:hypothetical protein D3C84_730050 [compost metagenome]